MQLGVDLAESRVSRVARVSKMLWNLSGTDLVILPEMWSAGFFAFDRYAEEAEPLDGDTAGAIREAAAATGAYIHGGSFVERAGDGRLHNTSILVSPEGEIVHVYRKVHLFGYRSREAELLTPGSSVETYRAAFGVAAMTTCYDLRFPESYRIFLDKGAEFVLVPAAWPASRVEHWRLLTRARAIENEAVVVGCNVAGIQDGVAMGGHSIVVDPWGEVIAEAGAEEELITVNIDPRVVSEARAEYPWISDRKFRVEGRPQ